MAEDEDLHKGDEVTWNASQGTTEGEVKKRITDDIEIKDNSVKASEGQAVPRRGRAREGRGHAQG